MKPILFNTEMVRAILEGRKTATRRTMKNPPPDVPGVKFREVRDGMAVFEWDCSTNLCERKPPYHPGDILWVRETWCEYIAEHIIDGVRYAYRANATPTSEEMRQELGYKWSPSIHMPKEAARLFLRVTGVRVERLQDITFGETKDEGIWHQKDSLVREDLDIFGPFAVLWDSTIKSADLPLYGWEANPWVWVIEFERISKDEALGGGGDV